ncbi:VOC family protein [Nakamurella sp. YIM 132087]|uniref:VOC family protein n=1 Tax=Nakamurella alba TaxID=2665158 RepID=A0A7K1FL23_9ACTN|nr:VOC family protein [Nakamurella alba]MTD14841.1 VOC family protein [Nakamurella alba]
MSGIAAWLTVGDASAAVAFYGTAFGAAVVHRTEIDGQVIVARLSLAGSEFWVQQDDGVDPAARAPQAVAAVRMIVSNDDPDDAFARAVATGAIAVADPHTEHGWRTGRVRDPFGHEWELSREL